MLRIDLLTRRQSYDLALSALEDLASKLQNEGQDIYYRIRLLSMKAYLLDKCGRAEKGFSVALRAASLAHRARLLPALWEAMGAVSNVLINLGEFEAAGRLLGSIMPQVSLKSAGFDSHTLPTTAELKRVVGSGMRRLCPGGTDLFSPCRFSYGPSRPAEADYDETERIHEQVFGVHRMCFRW